MDAVLSESNIVLNSTVKVVLCNFLHQDAEDKVIPYVGRAELC